MKSVGFFLISILLLGCDIEEQEAYTDFFTLSGGTFPMEIDVLITPDTEAAAQYVRDNRLDSTITACDFDGAAGLTFDFQDKPGLIWLSSIDDPAIINHELLHATINIMNYSGVSLSDSSEEAYAYELQYLTNQFYNKIKP